MQFVGAGFNLWAMRHFTLHETVNEIASNTKHPLYQAHAEAPQNSARARIPEAPIKRLVNPLGPADPAGRRDEALKRHSSRHKNEMFEQARDLCGGANRLKGKDRKEERHHVQEVSDQRQCKCQHDRHWLLAVKKHSPPNLGEDFACLRNVMQPPSKY